MQDQMQASYDNPYAMYDEFGEEIEDDYNPTAKKRGFNTV